MPFPIYHYVIILVKVFPSGAVHVCLVWEHRAVDYRSIRQVQYLLL